jgi:hypothetical protein
MKQETIDKSDLNGYRKLFRKLKREMIKSAKETDDLIPKCQKHPLIPLKEKYFRGDYHMLCPECYPELF